MRTRIVNDGGRRAGTSVKLTTFAVLEEEDEIMRPKDPADEEAKRAIDLGNLREQAERMKGMNWADIADEEELEGFQKEGDWNGSRDKSNSGDSDLKEDGEEEEAPVEVVLDIKPESSIQTKSKKAQGGKGKDNFDDLIADLTKLNVVNGEKIDANEEHETDRQVATEEREKAKAQLRAKIAASATSRKKSAKEEETKKKTKSEKKEARKQFER